MLGVVGFFISISSSEFFNRLRFDRIIVMSLWPHFLPSCSEPDHGLPRWKVTKRMKIVTIQDCQIKLGLHKTRRRQTLIPGPPTALPSEFLGRWGGGRWKWGNGKEVGDVESKEWDPTYFGRKLTPLRSTEIHARQTAVTEWNRNNWSGIYSRPTTHLIITRQYRAALTRGRADHYCYFSITTANFVIFMKIGFW